MKEIRKVIVYVNDKFTNYITDVQSITEVGGLANTPLMIIFEGEKEKHTYILNNIYGYEVIYK